MREYTRLTGPKTWAGAIAAAAAVLGAQGAAPVRAEYITNTNGIVLKDDFEAPVSGGTGYQVGDSPTSGPWTVNPNPVAEDFYAKISQAPGETDQSALIYGAYASHTTELRYSDTAYHNYPQEYYYDWDWIPGADTTADRTQTQHPLHSFLFADSYRLRAVLEFGVTTTYTDGDASTAVNHFFVRTGEGTKTLAIAAPNDDWVNIQLHLVPVDAASGKWSYSLWINGQNQALNQSFTVADSGASKADVFDYQMKWQDHAKSYIDNFSWRTDRFETPVPEPGSLTLLGLGGLALLSRKRRRDHSQ